MNTFSPKRILGALTDLEEKYAPKILFYEGNLDLLTDPKVSLIGTRNPSTEGKKRAHFLSRALVEQGVVVVSGLAKGIDTIAHEAAIKHGGNTIAVLGTPLDKCYPPENEELLSIIKSEFLAVSQFPEGKPVHPSNFPIRNRTMALLSDATIIVEAGEKSGTRHQGWEAIRLGRTLFMLESVANDPNLTWPRKMIEYGAQVLRREGFETILFHLPIVTNTSNTIAI